MKEKEVFLLTQAWNSTVRASFGRTGLYQKNISLAKKEKLRNELFKELKKSVFPLYQTKVGHEEHNKNICSVSEKLAQIYKDVINSDAGIIGVSQKLLNLYLKYLWCLNEGFPTPPHFPVDWQFQSKLLKLYKKHKIKTSFEIIPWTTLKRIEDYEKIIQFVADFLNECKNRSITEYSTIESLAELELKVYQNQ